MIDFAKLRICFLAGCLGQGGAERQLYYILRSLRNLGLSPSLVSLTRGEYWETKIRQLGVPVTWVGHRRSRSWRLVRIVRVLRRVKPDIIQSQHFFTNLYAVGAARILQMREIGAIRNNVISELRINGPVLGRLCLRAPHCLVANSHQAVKTASELGVPTSRLKFVPNVVDTNMFTPMPRARRNDNRTPPRLLLVGRLATQKRGDLFLRAIARLRSVLPKGARGQIVGDGPERTNLERQAAELGLLPESVRFTGAVSDMPAVYRQADVLVLTSDWEGTPNVILEAMASGLPVVATRVGGVPEVVQEGVTGLLVEPGDVAALTNRLAELAASAEMRARFGHSARQYVLANHSLDKLTECLRSLYRAILS